MIKFVIFCIGAHGITYINEVVVNGSDMEPALNIDKQFSNCTSTSRVFRRWCVYLPLVDVNEESLVCISIDIQMYGWCSS